MLHRGNCISPVLLETKTHYSWKTLKQGKFVVEIFQTEFSQNSKFTLAAGRRVSWSLEESNKIAASWKCTENYTKFYIQSLQGPLDVAEQEIPRETPISSSMYTFNLGINEGLIASPLKDRRRFPPVASRKSSGVTLRCQLYRKYKFKIILANPELD